jgi:pre-mRNA-splicing factor SYF1
LLKNDLLEEALTLYVQILNDEGFVSKRGNKAKFQLWMELCEFISRSPLRA